MPGRELVGHPLRDGFPDAAEPPRRGRPRAGRDRDPGDRQERGRDRRRRHRQRLHRHVASAGRRERDELRDHAAAAGGARPQHAVAAVAADAAHVVVARRGRRAATSSVSTERFVATERPRHRASTACGSRCKNGSSEPVPGTEFEIEADLVLLAMGFVHPEQRGIVEELGRRARRPRQRAASTAAS